MTIRIQTLAAVLSAIFSVCQQIQADDLPLLSSDRRTTWSPGVPGGIPEIQGPIQNVLDHGADPTGVEDSKAAFDAAVATLPAEGGVVFVPEGTYRMGSKWYVGRSGIVVRGEGTDKTRLLCDHNDTCVEVSTYQEGEWQPLLGDFQKASTSVLVQNGAAFEVGKFAEIQQDNDPALMFPDNTFNELWAANAAGQVFEVVAVEGNRVHFRTPVHYPVRADLNPRIRPQQFVKKIGFENFYIERTQIGGDGFVFTFLFKNTAYCWVKKIESYRSHRAHIYNEVTIGNEFRDSYFHHAFSYGEGGLGYGVEFALHGTDGLCENNIFDTLRHAMMVHLGAVGCVFGYNYSRFPTVGDNSYAVPDISLHGHWPQMNLFEGNVVQFVYVADYWGPAGPGNTLLRNRIGFEGVPQAGGGLRPGLFLVQDHSHGQNFIGNVSPMYENDGVFPVNPRVSTNIFRHGEKIANVMTWMPNITDQVIPTSYYLSEKPSFFGRLPWPITGSDLPDDTLLPAQLRYDADGDALPDLWEIQHFGSTNTVNGAANADPDVDGSINLDESRAGTDPLEASSVLKFVDVTGAQSNQRGLSWKSVLDRTYTILSGANLGAGLDEVVIQGLDASPSGTNSIIIDDVPGSRFYRVLVEPQFP